MDANGTRFHLLLGYDDWASVTDHQGRTLRSVWESSPPADGELAWDAGRHELILKPRLFQFIAAPTDQPVRLEDRRGAARDRYGNWYWIDESRLRLRVHSAGSGQVSDFWPTVQADCHTPKIGPSDFEPRESPPLPSPSALSGLAITDDHYLVVGVLEPAGLLIFDLHAGGAPQQVFWPPTIKFAPFDMAARPGGGVWILDRENLRYWALDRHFNVIGHDPSETTLAPEQVDAFQPSDGSVIRKTVQQTFPEGAALNAASPVAAQDPIAIEALPDGSILILDQTPGKWFAEIHHYRHGQLLASLSTQDIVGLVEEGQADRFQLIAHDFAYTPEGDKGVAGKLYLVAAEGNQSYAFDVYERDGQLQLQPLAQYFPMRLFGGKALVVAGIQVYYDFGERWIPLLDQRRPRYEAEATCETRPFDGREPNCVWHRLMLDACIPPETQVKVWSRTANTKADLPNTRWQPEPNLYRRADGPEQPYLPKPAAKDSGTWELLFQRARGRYLQLRLSLAGNGRSTPRLRALRAYYPRFSYLEHYLPAVYRQDRESASFLDRFLANFEGFYTTLEDKIAAAQVLFEAQGAPPEALEWLASWFGVALDPAWDEARRRLFIRHAIEFFQFRGTLRGLQIALRLAFDGRPSESIFASADGQASLGAIRIIEKFRTRRTPGIVFGDPTDATGPRRLSTTDRWLPTHGAEALHRAYRAALSLPDSDHFPLTDPGNPRWKTFARETLGFIPSASAADVNRWRQFLARRYSQIEALNTAYEFTNSQRVTSFAQLPLPSQLPEAAAPLQDWYLFESLVLGSQRNAHRFSVLLPVTRSARTVSPERQRQLALAKRIVELEKPAHTLFDVKFFWAMFRVGEARLGQDTLIDLGSRAPQLTPPMILNEGYLAESYLAPGRPYEVADRRLVGRDPLSN